MGGRRSGQWGNFLLYIKLNTMIDVIDIILIEDSLSDAEMTVRALGKTHLDKNLVHLEDGSEAINFIFAMGKYSAREVANPKVVILDLNMPKINGFEVLQKIRSDERTRNIAVVVLTSSKEDSDIKRCYNLGANSYIVKPVDYKEFSQAIIDIGQYWLQLNQISE